MKNVFGGILNLMLCGSRALLFVSAKKILLALGFSFFSAFILSSAWAESKNVVGVFEGKVGDQIVVACLDQTQRSAFYYLRDQKEITLKASGLQWSELIDNKEVAVWQFDASDDGVFSGKGYRTDLNTGIKLPIDLSRINFYERDIAACESEFYKPGVSSLIVAHKKEGVTHETKRAVFTKPNLVASGWHHAAIIDLDGRLWMWGLNEPMGGMNASGGLGDGTNLKRSEPILMGDDFSQIFAAGELTAAIKSDGSLWTWRQRIGKRYEDRVSSHNRFAITKIGVGFVHAAVGYGHGADASLIAVGDDGSLWANYPPNARNQKYALAKIGEGYSRVLAGDRFVVGLKNDGSMWTWGYDSGESLEAEFNSQYRSPRKIGDEFIDVQRLDYGVVGTKSDGSLWKIAINESNKKGYFSASTPEALQQFFVKIVSFSSRQTFALDRDGIMWAWGENFKDYAPLGNGTTKDSKNPVRIGAGFKDFAVGLRHVVAMKTDGSVWTWGMMKGYLEILDLDVAPTKVGDAYKLVSIAQTHTLAIKKDGTLWAWGSNSQGQIGAGDIGVIYDKPIKIGTQYLQAVAGQAHSLAIKRDHTLWAWGSNKEGQLGDGTMATRSRPVRIGRGFAQVAASSDLSLAIKLDGSLWVWGANRKNIVQQDIFNSDDRPRRPIPIRIGYGFSRIFTSDTSTIAVDKKGQAWEWRNNVFAKRKVLSEYSERPTSLGKDFKVFSLANGRYYAIDRDARLWTWGDDYSGALWMGKDMAHAQGAPLQIGPDFAHVVTADGTGFSGIHTLAIKCDGSLWGWGRNDSGQLANKFARNQTHASQVQVDMGFESVSLGGTHGLAIKKDGTLWGWGRSVYGQLGVGVSVRLKPTRVLFPVIESSSILPSIR